MAKPYASDAAGRDEDAKFPQFVTSPDLTMSRKVSGMLDDSSLGSVYLHDFLGRAQLRCTKETYSDS